MAVVGFLIGVTGIPTVAAITTDTGVGMVIRPVAVPYKEADPLGGMLARSASLGAVLSNSRR